MINILSFFVAAQDPMLFLVQNLLFTGNFLMYVYLTIDCMQYQTTSLLKVRKCAYYHVGNFYVRIIFDVFRW